MLSTQALTEKLAWISLGKVSGLGSQTYCQLLKAFGTPEQIYNTSVKQLAQVVKPTIAQEIAKGFDPEAHQHSLQWLSQPNNHLITLADEAYPKSLLEIADPPPYLYAKGDITLLNQAAIAIVGSRNATVQGEKNAEAFAAELCAYNLCIVSGLALGIDGAAHRGALKAKGKTIAVVGTGLDIVYPAKHRELAHAIAENGLIISEFDLGVPSTPQNFPRRNRIISGLSLGCLVVEANLQSGSQITARLATEQGREVFAIPGSIHSPMSKGCHQLIKQGAKLVDSVQDIVEELHLDTITMANHRQDSTPATSKNTNAELILSTLGFDPMRLEHLVASTGLTVSEVSSMLMVLELEGKVASLTGGHFQKIM